MKYIKILIISLFIFTSSAAQTNKVSAEIPEFLLGSFTDDYGINYFVSKEIFGMGTKVKYHILKWDIKNQYILAKNDANNPSDKDLFTRIDFMTFENMEPYKWGFCFTEYKAETMELAEQKAAADRANPKKGCNGYPFSRMKRANN